ncbi:MAG: hypothetical protein HOH04_09390, partial [Rhodospirillaceae bacterium]|nr:hypothetical protein [Rhodospirillaceae bacterium]
MPTERTEPENDAEKLLLEMARIGEIADVSDLTDNVIRGAFLRELATQSTKHGIHEQGVRVKGAYISGKIDFTACSLAQPFWIIESILEKVIRLRVARTRNLGFPGTEIPGLKGDGLRVDGSIFLSSAVFSDELRLLGATITGDLDCIGASFFSAAGFAINAERLVVERRILLLNIKQLEGGIDFMHSRAGDFGDHRSGWPNKGMLIIDGLVYDNLGPEENSAASRIKWLQLMPDTQNDEPVYFP